jgi:hypothetical protein
MNRIKSFLLGAKEDITQNLPRAAVVLLAVAGAIAILAVLAIWLMLAVFSIHDYIQPMTVASQQAYVSSGQFKLDRIKEVCGSNPTNCTAGEELAKTWGMKYEYAEVEGTLISPNIFYSGGFSFRLIDPQTGEETGRILVTRYCRWFGRNAYCEPRAWLEGPVVFSGDRVKVGIYRLYDLKCKVGTDGCYPRYILNYVQRLPGVRLSPLVNTMVCRNDPRFLYQVFHCPWW